MLFYKSVYSKQTTYCIAKILDFTKRIQRYIPERISSNKISYKIAGIAIFICLNIL